MTAAQDPLLQRFQAERTAIGQGMMSKVFLWNGFAYKCFRPDYPESWLQYEKEVQAQICTTALPVVRYFDSEISNSIKMEYISGVTLAERIRKEKYAGAMDDLMAGFSQIHQVTGLSLPSLSQTLHTAVEKTPAEAALREKGAAFLQALEKGSREGDCLCHMDYHFLNVMYTGGGIKIIDWIGAHNGKPLFDFARSYVIMYEFVTQRYADKLRTAAIALNRYDPADFDKAVFVMALHRLTEYDDPKVHKLLAKYV